MNSLRRRALNHILLNRTVKLSAARLLLAPLFLAAGRCSSLRADDWPQWRGPNRDGVWSETGIVEKFPDKQLKIKWHAEIGPGFSGPTVADGRVLVTDRQVEPKQVERVFCFDEQTGKKLWSYSYDCTYSGVGYDMGPRAAVSLDSGRAYALGAMGNLHCFDAKSGNVLWEKDLLKQYKIRMPIWGIAAAPLVDGDLVILQIGGEGACVVALDKVTGAEKWKALDDRASYAAPIIVRQAGRRVLICWTGDSVAGLDPATGEVLWRQPFKPSRMVINVATPVMHDDRLFLTSFYDGSMMLRLGPAKLAVEQLWRQVGPDEQKTKSLQLIIGTPYFDGPNVYGIDSYGQMRCLDAKNGDRVWESQVAVPKARWATVHMVRNGERMFMFNELGELIIADLRPTAITRSAEPNSFRRRTTKFGSAAAEFVGRTRRLRTSKFSPAMIAKWSARASRRSDEAGDELRGARAEGPAVRPAQGNALGRRVALIRFGPTGQPFGVGLRIAMERLARWAEMILLAPDSPGRCPGLGEQPLRENAQRQNAIAADELATCPSPSRRVGLACPTGDIPEHNRPIHAAGGEPFSIRAERQGVNHVGVPEQHADVRAVGDVPHVMVRSSPAEARVLPSGLNATAAIQPPRAGVRGAAR